LIVALLTVATQVGGVLIWPTLCLSTNDIGWRYRIQRIFIPVSVYFAGSWWLVPFIASFFNSVPMPCSAEREYPIAPRTYLTCLTNRNYVQKEVRDELLSKAKLYGRLYSRSEIHYLDAGFPIPMMPPLPHLSHNDGKKIDLSFIWHKNGQSLFSPSPIGYGNMLNGLEWFYEDTEIDHKKTREFLLLLHKSTIVKSIVLNESTKSAIMKKNQDKTKFIEPSLNQINHDDHYKAIFF
jgi:hypothetical protein